MAAVADADCSAFHLKILHLLLTNMEDLLIKTTTTSTTTATIATTAVAHPTFEALTLLMILNNNKEFVANLIFSIIMILIVFIPIAYTLTSCVLEGFFDFTFGEAVRDCLMEMAFEDSDDNGDDDDAAVENDDSRWNVQRFRNQHNKFNCYDNLRRSNL